MIGREMLVCLATSALLCFVVFFYFRNRLKAVEYKLNTLFQLIQDHVSKQKTEEKELIQQRENGGYDNRLCVYLVSSNTSLS